MRVYIEIKKPIISLLSETISNYNQDIISLTTDLVLLYNRKKIISVKKELKKTYFVLKDNISATKDKTSKEKKIIENEIYDDKTYTTTMNIWLYDICPFVCSLEDVIYSKIITFPKRKIMNNFNFNYNTKTIMQYLDPNNYVITYNSSMEIKHIVLKISYRDLVLFLKVIEFNNSVLNEEYENNLNSLKNKAAGMKNFDLDNDQNPQNDSRYSLRDCSTMPNESFDTNFRRTLMLGNSNKQSVEMSKVNDKEDSQDRIIDNGISIMNVNLDGIQIVILIFIIFLLNYFS